MMKQRIVIKLGGSALQNPQTTSQLAILVRGFQKQGNQVVIVHGGGPAINAELTKRGISWQFINGQRQTTPEMMAVVNHVLAGQVNSDLVEKLQADEIFAVGLSAADEKILFCTQAHPELMQVGQIEAVNTNTIEKWFTPSLDRVPVIAPIGFGASQEKYNINADWAAAKIAIALSAKKLVFLTDQDGILDANKMLVPRLNIQGIEIMIADGTISGGMYTKAQAMMTALNSGVKQVRVLHAGQAGQALGKELVGTTLTKSQIRNSQAQTNSGDLNERAS
jgi:acetylglutamate kinase